MNPEIVGEFSSPSLISYTLEKSQYVGFLPSDMVSDSSKLMMIDEIPESDYILWSYTLKDSKVRGCIDKYLD